MRLLCEITASNWRDWKIEQYSSVFRLKLFVVGVIFKLCIIIMVVKKVIDLMTNDIIRGACLLKK